VLFPAYSDGEFESVRRLGEGQEMMPVGDMITKPLNYIILGIFPLGLLQCTSIIAIGT
jgi:hypothetical protein